MTIPSSMTLLLMGNVVVGLLEAELRKIEKLNAPKFAINQS